MKLFQTVVVSLLLDLAFTSISNISVGPTGNFAKISPSQGMYVSVILLVYVLFAELGYLPFKFVGKKKRSLITSVFSSSFFSDRDTALKVFSIVCYKRKRRLQLDFLK